MTFVVTRGDLRRQGLSDGQVTRLLRAGRLMPVRRGILGPPEAGHVEELRAVLTAHRRDLVVSHLSAARLLNLPRPLAGWGRPEFTGRTGSPRSRSDLRISVATLPDSQVCVLSGLCVTTPARTVVDCARSLPPRDGLAVADAVLHAKLVTAEELQQVLQSQAGWPGSVTARNVLALADGRRESPLESWSAWAFEQAGVPRPEWQLVLRTTTGRFLGRCDAWWPGVAGEADGRSKYRLAAAERGGADADTLFQILAQERQREMGFRGVHAEVIRWEAGEVLVPARTRHLAARIGRALLDASGGRLFTGRTDPISS